MRSILDPAFRYVPSFATSVAATWRRFGWRPTTEEDRKARPRPTMELVVDWIGAANAHSARDVSAKIARGADIAIFAKNHREVTTAVGFSARLPQAPRAREGPPAHG
jgi:hypothetical protein